MTQSFEAGLKWLRGLHLALWQRIRDLGTLVLDPPHCSRSKGLIVKSLEIEREEKGFGKRDRDTGFPACQNDVFKGQTLQQRPKTLDQYSLFQIKPQLTIPKTDGNISQLGTC